ncbi:MAG: DUF393 domain-containing protein [Candidatus Sericytochromatia bacterium]|nr:DUF393 domain-containing protein [Candidatus Sericytochromatia bacterium]
MGFLRDVEKSRSPSPPEAGRDDGLHYVLYDGDCGLCDALVALMMRAPRRDRFRFVPLQNVQASPIAQELEAHIKGPWGSSVLVLCGGRWYERSDAVLAIARTLGGPLAWLGCLRFVPRAWRDVFYDWIARHRLRWFGRAPAGAACRLAPPEARALMLDQLPGEAWPEPRERH